MINSKDCLKLLLEKFPNFKETWLAHLAWWGGEERGLCIDMAAFGSYAIELIKTQNNQDELAAIFIFIEKLMIEGDQNVRDAAATCFLENLINSSSGNEFSALSFVHLLGDKSKAYCKAWDEFTGVKTEGLWDDNK